MNKRQKHFPVQCLHSIGFCASGIVVGIAGIVAELNEIGAEIDCLFCIWSVYKSFHLHNIKDNLSQTFVYGHIIRNKT